jgi:transposase-like protein
MTTFPQSFEVYGFTIEVHSGGRRVWPPSFKRFITQQLDNDELTVGEVMKTCNVSQSLVYKWRSDIRNTRQSRTAIRQERVFSEIVIEDTEHP